MKTLKTEFQSEAQRAGFQTLEELNSALWAWIDVEYNRRNHSSTGNLQTPGSLNRSPPITGGSRISNGSKRSFSYPLLAPCTSTD